MGSSDEESRKPAAEEPGAHPVRAAFVSLAETVSGEVESVQRSLADMETALKHAADREMDARVSALDGLESDLSSRIDEVVGNQAKVLEELKQSLEQQKKSVEARVEEMKTVLDGEKERIDGYLDDVTRATAKERERVDGAIHEMKDTLESNVDERIKKLAESLDALGSNLAALQLDVQAQASASERANVLLSNMAGVFSGSPAQASPTPVLAAAQETATETDDEKTRSADPEEVDDALERIFT